MGETLRTVDEVMKDLCRLVEHYTGWEAGERESDPVLADRMAYKAGVCKRALLVLTREFGEPE